MNRNQKILHKFLLNELTKFPHAKRLEEGVLDRMGARIAGAWSKGISGDESRAIAKKVQRIINTHRVEMESDFAKLDITDTAAVEQVLDAMRQMENAAKQYLGGAKGRSGAGVTKQGTAAAPIDTNKDGKPDAQDTDGDGKPDAFDTDGDGTIDSQDTNKDGKPDKKIDGGPVDAGGAGTVNVYKGRGGKGLRSTLDKLKINPKVSNVVLRAVADQLKSQGINVLEEEEELEEMVATEAARPRTGRLQTKAPTPDIRQVQGSPAHGAAEIPMTRTTASQRAKAAEEEAAEKAAAEPLLPIQSLSDLWPEPAPAPAAAPQKAPAAAPQKTAGSPSGPKINLGGKGGVRMKLAQAGIKGPQLSQVMKAIYAWGKGEGIQMKESSDDSDDEMIVESRFNRWLALAGIKVLKG